MDDMLLAFDGLLHGSSAAKFAVLPSSQGVEWTELRSSTSWEQSDVLSTTPFLARLLGKTPIGEEDPEHPVDFPILFAIEVEQNIILCSVANSVLFRQMANRFLLEYYPEVGRAFWDTPALFKLLHHARQQPAGSGFRVTELTFRNPIDGRADELGWESLRRWTNRSLDDAYQELLAIGAWARSIGFEFNFRTNGFDSSAVAGSASRSSIFTAKSGVRIFWDTIIAQAIRQGNSSRRLFANRERGEDFQRAARPLVIEYGTPVFDDRTQNRLLVEKLRDLPEGSVSVFHGNPYLHASVVDHLDGSSFQIWVLNPTRIRIVPGARATTASLERLSSHIMDHFREGELRES